MDSISFFPQTFGRLINVLLILLILAYFIPLRKQFSAFSKLAYYFLISFLFHAGYLYTFAINSEAGAWGMCLAVTAPFGLAFMLQFAYEFPREYFSREKKIVFAVSMVLCTLSVVEYLYGFSVSGNRLTATGFVSLYVSKTGPALSALLHLTTIFVFFRQARAMRNDARSKDDPGGPATFARVILLEIVASIFIYAYLYSIRPSFNLHSTLNIITFVVLAAYTIVLLKYSRRFISMTHKLIGLSFTITLLCFNLFGHFFMQEKLNTYEDKARLSLHQFMRFQDKNTLLKTEYVFDLKQQRFLTHTTDQAMLLGSIWSYLAAETISGKTDKFIHTIDERNFVQFLMNYNGSPILAGFDGNQYRAITHQATVKIIVLLFSFLTILAVLFPFLVNNGILHPVRNLVESMQSLLASEKKQSFNQRESELETLSNSMHVLQNSMQEYETLQGRYKSLEDKLEQTRKNTGSEFESQIITEKVSQVKKFIEENYSFDISREGLAASVNMSVSSLGKAFKHQNQLTIREYLNQVRVAESCNKLAATSEPIINIAYAVGFESLRTFNRAFRKIKNCSPSEYREVRLKEAVHSE